MADMGSTAVEKLHYGVLREYKANEGTATAATAPEYDYGTGDTGGYTYATLLTDDVVVIMDTTADFTVKRAGTGATGKTLVGFVRGVPQGKAGETREVRVYHFGNHDVLRFKCASAVAVGDKVSLSGAYDATLPHGFKVATDNTDGMGYALNSTAADGEVVAVWCKPGTFLQG